MAPGCQAADSRSPESESWPSIGVLISTFERPHLLREALGQIALQQYPGQVQAIVVDDSAKSLEQELADLRAQGAPLPELNYVYLKERVSIGAKRNLAARSTDAEVLCVWDDDDVFTMDRLRKQVEHLRSRSSSTRTPVSCSAIEVGAMYHVPKESLTLRPMWLPEVVYENTLCFTRAWWESNKCQFGEAWAVSGQGEGTLEPWWEEVQALTGSEEPFLYIYLPSSVSGGTPEYLDPHPEPDTRFFSLLKGLQGGRFPDQLEGPHVRGCLKGARACLERMMEEPQLFSSAPLSDFDEFKSRYGPVRERWLASKR